MGKGRPSKYDEAYCEQLIDHMSKGYSFESFAGVLSICRDTLYEWCSAHEDFSYAKKRATQKSLLALETIGLEGMKGDLKGFNVASWIFTCKNRHSDMFKDKMEIGTVDNKPFVLKYSLDD